MVVIILVIQATPTVLEEAYRGLQTVLSQPVSLMSVLGAIIFLDRSLLALAVYAIALFMGLAELNYNNPKRKRMHRTRVYKLVAFALLPLAGVQLVVTILALNQLGWEQATSVDWTLVIGSFLAVVWGLFILSIFRNPVLYFNRAFSLTYDLYFVVLGFFLAIRQLGQGTSQSVDPLGLLLMFFGLVMAFRTLSGRETVAQQTIASIFRLPDLVERFVPVAQRQLALRIALGEYLRLSKLEQEQLEQYLVQNHKPHPGERVKRIVLALVTAFLLAFLAEGPASYLFTKLIEQIAD